MKDKEKIKSKKQARKDAILMCAIEQFKQYYDINIRELAKDTQEHIPVIYTFFGSKEELLEMVIHTLLSEWKNGLLYALDTHIDAFIKLTQLGVNYIKFIQKDKRLANIILSVNFSEISNNLANDHTNIAVLFIALKDIIRELYYRNVCIYSYDEHIADEVQAYHIEVLMGMAWGHVVGLGNILANEHQFQFCFVTDIKRFVIASFMNISLVKQEYIANHPQLTEIHDIISSIYE